MELELTIRVLVAQFPCGHWKTKLVVTWPDGVFAEIESKKCHDTKEAAGDFGNSIAESGMDEIAALYPQAKASAPPVSRDHLH